jgi:hypothetical protein
VRTPAEKVVLATARAVIHIVDHGAIHIGTSESYALVKALSDYSEATGEDPYLAEHREREGDGHAGK